MSDVRALLRCFAIYREMPWRFTAVTAATVVVNLGQPGIQYLIGVALGEVERGVAVVRLAGGAVDTSRAWWWAALLVGVSLVRAIVQWGVTVAAIALGQELLHRLRSRIFAQVQRLDLGWHRVHGAGEVISRATRDADLVRDAVTGGWRTALELVTVVLGTLALLAWYHPLLAVVPGLLIVTACLLLARTAPRLTALDRRSDSAYDGMMQDLSEGVQGVRVIKTFALEGPRIARFAARIEQVRRANRRMARYAARVLPWPQIVVSLGHAWVLGAGAWLHLRGQLPVSDLVTAMLAMQALVFRIEAIGRLMQILATALASAGRIDALLARLPAVAGGAAPVPAGALRLEAVTALNGGRRVLHDLSLTIAPASVTALVGTTGSGKSTLAELLPRLRDADAGRITLGGADLRSLDLEALRRHVQVVFQEGFLFSGTIADNLRLGAPSAGDDDLWQALADCAADGFVRELPLGLAAVVGERGVTLSGGQRQRLCLARALLARPAVLVCDDATSALDATTESLVLTRIRARLPQAALLFIAARPSTVGHAQRVLLLADGRIAAEGTPAAMAGDPRVRDLLDLDGEDARG